jgi:uncharacterized protein
MCLGQGGIGYFQKNRFTKAVVAVHSPASQEDRVLAAHQEGERMTIPERIQEDLKEAMRAKNSLRLDVLRSMKTAIKNKEIEKVKTLADAEVTQVLYTLVKQRKDSIEQFQRGGRNDLASREQAELEILESYLPAAVSSEEIDRAVAEVIADLQVTSPKDIGKVMKTVMGKFSGKLVDGKQVSDAVRARLGG